MLTIGEILIKVRTEKKLTLEEIEKQLRIRKKFLVALEENNWDKLPSLPYIKGFLRNYSAFLGLKPEEMVAVFRRQYAQHERTKLLPEGVTNPLNEPALRLTPQAAVIVVTVFCILTFFGYLFIQYRSYTSPPNLIVSAPAEGAVISGEKITISGITDRDAVISVNNQKIALSENGEFVTDLTLAPGVNTITIDSVSKYGKKKTVTRTVQIQSSQ